MEITVNSKDVSEVLEKRHDNLLRAIRKYIVALGDNSDKYFIPVGDGKKCSYNITKAGCDVIAGRMVGRDGDEFRSWYTPIFSVVSNLSEDYTVQQVAEMLGMSERAVYRSIQQGKLEAVDKEILVPIIKKFVTAEELDKFKAERGVKG